MEPKLRLLTKEDFATALKKGVKVIDTRSKDEFAASHIPGTINIQNNNLFSTWMGWLLTYEEPFILIAEQATHDDLVRKLMRIGLDNIYGYVDNVHIWATLGNALEQSNQVTLDEFKTLRTTSDVQVIDLRGEVEFKQGHIPGAENLFVGTLDKNLDKVNKNGPVVVHCQAGDRSTFGYSLLLRAGFKNVRNFAGGMNAWQEANLAVEASKAHAVNA